MHAPLRPVDWVLIAYFTYASCVGLYLPVARTIAWTVVAINLAVIAATLRITRVPGLRDWWPLPLMLLGYKEMGWFALPHASTALEESWVRWDRLLLNDWGARAAIESLGPVIPGILEMAYTLVYTIGAFCLIILWRLGRLHRAAELLFCLLLGTLASYALFPFFPSEPPRTVFRGEDLPNYELLMRRFNYWLLGNWGIHTSVFPSAHVSSSMSAAFALLRVMGETRWPGRAVLVLASLIAVSTVYGRYHYLVDALAGVSVAAGAWLATRAVYPED